MSMRDYAIDDYGLVLKENTLRYIAMALYDDCTEDTWNEDEYEFIEGVMDTLGLSSISAFTGEAIRINADGGEDWAISECYDFDSVYYLSVSKYPNLFMAPYKNIEELINEFKIRIGKYLPSDFSYEESTCHIIGTYFG